VGRVARGAKCLLDPPTSLCRVATAARREPRLAGLVLGL
jgi:hypothetical protein